MTNFRITPEQAIQLVKGFTTDASLSKVAKSTSMGGTINLLSIYGRPKISALAKINEVSFLTPPKLFNGVMAWTCWNDFDIPGLPSFFLAFEVNDSYLDSARVPFPDMRELMRPSHVFNHGGEAIDIMMAGHQTDPKLIVDYVITRQEVMQYCQNYESRGPSDSSGAFNKYPYGFFENESSNDVSDFLAQPDITFIRYYFGFDPALTTSNRIRLILVPVDKYGKNIFNDKAVLLQHSWPPPPYNK